MSVPVDLYCAVIKLMVRRHGDGYLDGEDQNALIEHLSEVDRIFREKKKPIEKKSKKHKS